MNFRTGLAVAGGLIPIAYCGGLVWYFTDMGGLSDPLLSKELTPTILGLALVELLFVFGFGYRFRRFFKRPPSPGGEDGHPPAMPYDGGEQDADAATDAMIARYLAQRETTAPVAPAASAAPASPAATFGRRASVRPS